MTITAYGRAKTAFREHALDEFPREAVGAVTEDGRYVPLKNRADDPEWDFRVHPAELPRSTTRIWHSHSRSQLAHPTLSDIHASELWPQYTFGVARCDGLNIGPIEQWGRDAPIEPLEGRTFLFFVRDCAKIIVDYFWLERGIRLRNWPRDPSWLDRPDDLWRIALEQQGFRQVSSPQEGDVMLLRLARRHRRAVHGGIVYGSAGFLHHPEGATTRESRLSRVDDLHQWQRRHLHGYWRL